MSGDIPPPAPPSPWATGALRDLALAESELRRLRSLLEAQAAAAELGLQRAALGARREERRLLERVEQDHRDAQRHLETLRRDNEAAASASLTLLERRLGGVTRLRRALEEQEGAEPLLREIQELLRPWEICVRLKTVGFRPSPQPNAVRFGETSVAERSLRLRPNGGTSHAELRPQTPPRRTDSFHDVATVLRRMEDGVAVTTGREEVGEEEAELRMVARFGKRGSGRSELTLPSGVHATANGQLYVADSGNARIQVTDLRGNVLQQLSTAGSSPFDLAVNSVGLLALSCERALLVFNRHGRRLQAFSELSAPRGVAVSRDDAFLVADARRGELVILKLAAGTGARLGRTVVPGFRRPYLVAACRASGAVAVAERGDPPCVKLLEPGWRTVRVLGAAPGPVLTRPAGVCIDARGNVLVADWAESHRVVMYPARGAGRAVVSRGLQGPRGLGVTADGRLAVCDSGNHCVKLYALPQQHGTSQNDA